jgi:hypothetical protein
VLWLRGIFHGNEVAAGTPYVLGLLTELFAVYDDPDKARCCPLSLSLSGALS